jgi:plastocyanin
MVDSAREGTIRSRYRRTRGVRLVGVVVFALLLGSFVTVARPSVQGAQVSVAIQDYQFAPATLTVPVGTTVMWTNQGADMHTTTSDTGAWDSKTLAHGASFSFTFTKAGAFAYHCTFHSPMVAHVEVTPLATPTATATHPPPTNTPVPPTATPHPTPTIAPTNATTIQPIPTPPIVPTNATAIRPTPTTARATATPTATPSSTAGAGTTTPTAIPSAASLPASPATAPESAATAPQPGPVSTLPFANFVEPIRPFADLPDHRFFAATGHSLNFGFKSYWEQNGALAQFGYPISEEFLERGADGAVRTVQYFERARFEYHYDLGNVPYAVQLGMLGREIAAGRMSEPAFLPLNAATTPDGQFFAATGHTLSGSLAAFWQADGGLPTFGYPISEPFQESGADGISRTVQYFERYRLELHPEINTVELGRLGMQVAQSRGYIPSA